MSLSSGEMKILLLSKIIILRLQIQFLAAIVVYNIKKKIQQSKAKGVESSPLSRALSLSLSVG